MSWMTSARNLLAATAASRATHVDLLVEKLTHWKRRGLDIKLAIDGGAADGRWARRFRSCYPEARIVLIEPRREAQQALQAMTRSGDHVVPKLIGAAPGEMDFHDDSDQSSVLAAPDGSAYAAKTRTAMTTLDQIVADLRLDLPDLIKLDLQGYELEALKGASAILPHVQAVLVEVSFYAFHRGMPTADEVVPFMAERGLAVQDIFATMNRPVDGALAQADWLFLRQDHPLRRDVRWR